MVHVRNLLATILLLAVLPFVAAGQTVVQLPEVQGEVGETVPIHIVVEGFTGVAVFEMYIDYSSEIIDYISASGLSPAPVVNDINGRTNISWFSTTPRSLEDGDTLLTLNYLVVGSIGQVSALDFSSDCYLANQSSYVIPTSFEDGSILVFGPLPPNPFALLSPEAGSVLPGLFAELLWQSTTDPNPNDTPLFDVYLDTLADLSTAWLAGEALADTSLTIENLSDDHTYFWTVHASDSNTPGTWAADTLAFSIDVPESPGSFELLSPADEDTIWTPQVTLTWFQSLDPDPYDLPHYDVFLDTLADLSTATLVAEGIPDTTFGLEGLLDDHFYFWTVRATDSNTEGTYASDTLSFQTFFPEAPSDFSYLTPEDGSEQFADEVTVTWEVSSDPDPGEMVHYRVEWSESSDFSTLFSGVTDETSFTISELADQVQGIGHSSKLRRTNLRGRANQSGLDELPDDITLFWRVTAVDDRGLETPGNEGESWSFTVRLPDLPTPFTLLSPQDGDTVWIPEATLIWHASFDPDPDEVPFYDVYLDTLADLSTATLVAEGIADTTFGIEGLQDDRLYFWTVRATDSNTDGRWAEDTLSFHTYFPEPPSTFHLLTPPDSAVIGYEPPFEIEFSWSQSIDPDPDHDVLYAFWFTLSGTGFPDTTRSFGNLADTSYTINIPDSLNIEIWPDTLNVLWGVQAIAGGDTVHSEETWLLVFAPPLGVDEWDGTLPKQFRMEQAYPNPFNPTTMLVIALPQRADVRVEAFNIMGRRVALLHQGGMEAGYRQVLFDGSQLASGVYFVRATIPGRLNQTQKVLLTK